ncbi:MAG: GAF domain-containing protein, partial [Anaerolineales bacterium]|nr:GAF domain-containing protein [Anaerolineales bacterium]
MAAITVHENAITLLRVVSETMSQKLSVEESLTRVLKNLCALLKSEAGFIILPDRNDSTIFGKLWFKQGEETLHKVSVLLAPGAVNTCLQTQKPVRVPPHEATPRFHPSLDGIPGITPVSLLCVPLSVHEIQHGAIVLLNKQEGTFEEEDQNLLESLAGIFTHMLHTTDLVQELRIANADLEANRWEIIRSRNTLRALFDNVPLSFYIIDKDYQLLALNVSRSNRLQAKPQDLVGKRCYETFYRRHAPCPACKAHETFRDGQITTRISHQWLEDGNAEEWETSTYPIFDEAEQVSQVILSEENVTEKRQLEYQLIQSEKLAAVGQLAAGIAHEINNPLTAVIANVQLLRREIHPTDPSQDALELIGMAGARAAQVVRNLLDLTRKENYKFIPTDINVTIQKALELLQHEINAHAVALKFEPTHNLPELLASPEHLEGVWINLLSNAFDAVDHTGAGLI